MSDEILRLNQVISIVGLGKTWIYNACKKGGFPLPVKLGHRAVGWRRSEIERWVAERPIAGGRQ